jgi:hypothetical protein
MGALKPVADTAYCEGCLIIQWVRYTYFVSKHILLPPGVNPIAVNKYIISYIVSICNFVKYSRY